MTNTTTSPAWARGYPLEHLRRIAALFTHHDAPHTAGAFSRVREADVAAALDDGTLMVEHDAARVDTPVAAAIRRKVRHRGHIKDFTGTSRATLQRGDVYVRRFGWAPGHEREALDVLAACRLEAGGNHLYVARWQESAPQAALLAQLWPHHRERVAVKIPASAELIGVWTQRTGDHTTLPGLSTADRWTLRRLALDIPGALLADAVRALERVPAYADHYSSYNKGHAWGALALRGYDADDPACIVKPAEMSKRWQADNPGMLSAPCEDTPLRWALPELEPLLALVPGEHQRVRLMRLQPGGGELTRHADITDPEAGTGPGKVLRIHLPLITNPQVLFTSWRLNGERHQAWMPPGSAVYLDTRKPHTAVNRGERERVHLVVDAYSSPALLDLLAAGGDA